MRDHLPFGALDADLSAFEGCTIDHHVVEVNGFAEAVLVLCLSGLPVLRVDGVDTVVEGDVVPFEAAEQRADVIKGALSSGLLYNANKIVVFLVVLGQK